MATAQESAEAKAATEKAAEAKAATEKAAEAADEVVAVGYTVTGAAVVLSTKDKSERYLYRGAMIPDGVFTEDSIKHALSVGLIEIVK